MPDYQCTDCGHRFDPPKMASRLLYVCPECGSSHWALIKGKAPVVRGDDCDFSSENNGRGRYNPQTKMYHRHVNDTIDEAKRRGWDYTR